MTEAREPNLCVHWAKRQRRRETVKYPYSPVREALLTAALQRSVRVDSGNSQTQHVAYLSSIIEHDIIHPEKRRQFWYAAKARLDSLHFEISPQQRQRIEAALAKKVPPP